MKRITLHSLVVSLLFLASGSLFAQHGHFRPDSLTTVTLSGKVIVTTYTFQDTLKRIDSVVTRTFTKYQLDTNADGKADYYLNFGPDFYKPDSSNAVRPLNGDNVTIKGGESDRLTRDSLKMVVVYEINGKFWRDPFDANWNRMGDRKGGHGHGRDKDGYGFGFRHDSLTAITVKGVAMVDTTFKNEHFYLDANNDKTYDYVLNFGPYWYKPASGAVRPLNGETVEITGGLLSNTAKPMIIVYTINGKIWRDSTVLVHNLGGAWISKDMRNASKFTSPFDEKCSVTVRPGWSGGMMRNELFGQMLELMPYDLPNQGNEKVLAAFEISLFDGMDNNTLLQNGKMGSHMDFGTSAQIQLHYTDVQLQWDNFTEKSVQAKYWDNRTNKWVAVSDANVNLNDNTVTFSQNTVSNLVILTAAKSTTNAESNSNQVVESYSLGQNYPNPFNPSTVISYSIPKSGIVTLKVYNLLGKEVATLVSGSQAQGNYSVQFNASSLPSGMYIYELRSADFSMSRKMMLVK
ncbi:MAG: T9SS type A sorting domain-containing protein [Syntrophothermus sp.]